MTRHVQDETPSYYSQNSQASESLHSLLCVSLFKPSILACLNFPQDASKTAIMDNLEAAASSMLPLPQSNETVLYNKEEWERHRAIIEGMYPMKGMYLKGIIGFLKEHHGFVVK